MAALGMEVDGDDVSWLKELNDGGGRRWRWSWGGTSGTWWGGGTAEWVGEMGFRGNFKLLKTTTS